MLVMTTHNSYKPFELANTQARELEGKRTVSRQRETLSTVISNIHWTSFCGLSIMPKTKITEQ
jgi:hypothetical protein